MDLSFPPEAEALRAEARGFLEDRLSGPFSDLVGRGGPGDEHGLFERRWEWERELGRHRFTCLSWPEAYGGRGASFLEQVVFYEEYARAGGPGRLGLIGEGLIGPTILHFGSDAQRQRFLPAIAAGDELWCQGYSEPDAGSDLANIKTKATPVDGGWAVTGQKVWTSLAHVAQWCFVVARTDPDSDRHRGLSYLLVEMDQPGVEVRPITQVTGTAEFNEVFFDGAFASHDQVVGEVGGGWAVAMGTLAFERGALTLGQQLDFANELDHAIEAARANGAIGDPIIRHRLADAWVRLQIQRWSALRMLSHFDRPELGPEAMVSKLYWASFHRDLTELAVDVAGAAGQAVAADAVAEPDERGVDYPFDLVGRRFMFARADTIYGGSNQIQRNIIAERALGLPREPR